jgi:hypothetical protein
MDAKTQMLGRADHLSEMLASLAKKNVMSGGAEKIANALLNTFKFSRGDSKEIDNGQVLSVLGDVAQYLPARKTNEVKDYLLGIVNKFKGALNNFPKNEEFEKYHTVLSAVSGLEKLTKHFKKDDWEILSTVELPEVQKLFAMSHALLPSKYQTTYGKLEEKLRSKKNILQLVKDFKYSVSERDKTIQELYKENKELVFELTKLGIDVAGIVDPTPICDAAGACISLAEGDWAGAGLSLLSTLPYLGDSIAKPIKLARYHKLIEKLAYYSQKIKRYKPIVDNAQKFLNNPSENVVPLILSFSEKNSRAALPKLGGLLFETLKMPIKENLNQCFNVIENQTAYQGIKKAFNFVGDQLKKFDDSIIEIKNKFSELLMPTEKKYFQPNWRVIKALALEQVKPKNW